MKSSIDILKKVWMEGASDPALFLKEFGRNKKGQPIKVHDVPAQAETFKAYQSGNHDELYISGGNSGGKTYFLAELGIWASTYKVYPKRKEPFQSRTEFMKFPFGVLCTGKEQKHSNELWEEISGIFKRNAILGQQLDPVRGITIGTRLHTNPRITLRNGSYIDSIGLQEQGTHIVTGDYSLVLINEIGEVRHLKKILETVITQRTWRHGGIIVGAGTPRGVHTEYWSVLRRGLKELPPDNKLNRQYDPKVFACFADSRENPYADQERIKSFLEKKSQKLVDERVRGLFVEMENVAFKTECLDKCFTDTLPFETPKSGRMTIVHGLDFGRKQDYTVSVTLDAIKKPWRGIHFYRKGGGYGTWEEIFMDIKGIEKSYGGEFCADTTASSGDMQSEWLADLNIPFLAMDFSRSPTRKIMLINFLQRCIENGDLLLPQDWEQVYEELRTYPANMDYRGMATDCVIALGLACWAAEYFGKTGQSEDVKM